MNGSLPCKAVIRLNAFPLESSRRERERGGGVEEQKLKIMENGQILCPKQYAVGDFQKLSWFT